MASGSLRRQIGRLLVAGFDGLQLPVELRSLAREFGLGGVILFARNVAEPGQVAELSYEAARLVPDVPLWVSVDQEGGRVARLKSPFTEWPPMAALGRSGDVGLAERFARALAAELRAVGVTLDYAPVLDVHTNSTQPRHRRPGAVRQGRGGGPATAPRSSGRSRPRASRRAGSIFPGTATRAPTRISSCRSSSIRRSGCAQVEFVPFRAAVDAGVATIMTAHVLVPSLDEKRPATLSRRIVSGLLREELGYDGVILSDDLEMKAVANEYSVPAAAVLAIEAGCDGVLICSGSHDQQAAALESLVHAVEDGRLPYGRVEDALKRQQRAKERFLAAAPAAGTGRPLGPQALRQVLGCDEHRAIADEMARFA